MKKHISLAILFALLCQLAACGAVETPVDTTAVPIGDDTTAVESTGEYKKPSVDYKGETVTIAAHNYESAWKITSYHIGLEEENGDFINDAIVRAKRQTEEELNVKIELMPLTVDDRTNPKQLIALIMAGDDAWTFGTLRTSALAKLLATPSMVVDLNTVGTLDLDHTWWDQNSREEFSLYGKQYTVSGDVCFNSLGAPIVTYFNKSIIEDLKMEYPYQLVYDGKWTLDKMCKMAEEASNDLNGDGKVSLEDRFGYAGEQSSILYTLNGAGVRYGTKQADGSVDMTINSERTVNVLDKMQQFWNDQTICVMDGAEPYKSTFTSVFTDYMVPTFMDNRLLFISNQLLVALNLRDMEADFGILPPAKFDEAQKEYYSSGNRAWSENVIIPATNTKLDMTGYVLESLGYYYQQYVTPAFIDQTVLGKAVRDEDSVKMIEIIRENQIYDVSVVFNWGNLTGTMNGLVLSPDKKFASTWASLESAVTAAMQQTMDELKG